MLDPEKIESLEELNRIAEKFENGDFSDRFDVEESREYLIRIYVRILELDPTNEFAEKNLIYYLLESGWDLKEQMRYDKAIQYFLKVIQLNPNKLIPRAHYRLGFLYMENDPLKAVEHFMKAIQESDSIDSSHPEEHPKLTKEQRLKAHMQLAILTKRISQFMAGRANELYEKVNPDEEIFSTIEEMQAAVQEEMNRPFVLITDEEQKYLHADELEQLADSDQLILNVVDLKATYRRQTQTFSENEMKVIAHLFENKRSFFTQHELMMVHKMNTTDAVRQRLSRIRRKFRDGLDLDPIMRTLQGYRWDDEKAGMVKRKDDIILTYL